MPLLPTNEPCTPSIVTPSFILEAFILLSIVESTAPTLTSSKPVYGAVGIIC